jgi:hypothetical protein
MPAREATPITGIFGDVRLGFCDTRSSLAAECRHNVSHSRVITWGPSIHHFLPPHFWTLSCALWLALWPRPAVSADACDDLRGGLITQDVDWQMEIKPLLNSMLGGRCTGCHFGTRFPDMTDQGADAIYKLVNSYAIPGLPLQSGLFEKINCDLPTVGVRMPQDSIPLTLDEQALIFDWIAQGARGEDPDQPIPRAFVFRDGMESRRWY